MFAGKLLLLEIHQLPQRQPQDRIGLHWRKAVGLGHSPLRLQHREAVGPQGPLQKRCRRLDVGQPLLGLGLRAGAANDLDHLIEVGQCNEQSLQRVLAAAGSLQKELRAPAQHRGAVAQKLLQEILEGEHPRLAVHQRQEDQRKRRLQRGELIELVEDNLGIGIPLQLEDQPHRLLQIALVADRRNALDAILGDQLRNLLLDGIPRLLVGDLGNDDPVSVFAELLHQSPGPQRDRAAPGDVAADQRLAAHHDPAGGEIGPRNDFEQFGHRHVGRIDHPHQRPADLTQVVGRNARRHADGNTAGSVDNQIGESARQHHRFGVAFVVGRNVVDGVEFNVVEHHRRNGRKPGLRVPHRGCRQSRDRTEIALLVDEHMAHVPFLGHAHQRWVDHALAVRVVVAAGIAGDLGTLHPSRPGGEVEIVHRHQDPPLGRLEAVAHVGQGPRDDHAHRVGEVALFELLLDRHFNQPTARTVTEDVIPRGTSATGTGRAGARSLPLS